MDLEFDTFTLAALPKLPAKNRVALVIRHSHRDEITGSENVFIAGLTPQGVDLARQFGQELTQHRSLGRVLASPVSRCVDTAVAIADAAGYAGLVRVDDRLSHVLMKPIWYALPGIAQTRPVPPEINRLLELLLEPGSSSSNGELDLFVTHDTVVGALAGYLTGLPVSGEFWPQYLEGMYMWRDGNNIHAWWRGKMVDF